jgi:hypothetical protein
MKIKIKTIYIALGIVAIALVYVRCKQSYVPPNSSTNTKTLVIEGFINTGGDSTIFRLTRSIKLTDVGKAPGELNAKVAVETDNNTVYPLQEKGNGYYAAPALNAAPNSKYRLTIVTADNKTYQSDFVAPKNSPAIDSINFEVKANGVQVYSATHDATNNTRYYRWDFNEAWILYANYRSVSEAVKVPKDTIINRTTERQIYTCWAFDRSSSVVINSSAKLSQDVIVHNPVAFVASNSEKLRKEYSIGLKQYALTKEAFNYWQSLKKNTEQLGSIFDAQPSQLKGNIHSVSDPNEQVLGFVSAGATSSLRAFLGYSKIPALWSLTIDLPYDYCKLDTFYFNNPKTGANDVLAFYTSSALPIQPVYAPFLGLVGYSASPAFCADCRFRGTTKRPDYWIDVD